VGSFFPQDPGVFVFKLDQINASGVHIERAVPNGDATAPPIVFIHGGSHGAWLWEKWLPYFAGTGRTCLAFSWFNHNGSRNLPEDEFLGRSIAAVTEELGIVAEQAGQAPVLVAHSMGALVAQKYAEDHPVVAQVLLAPAACKEVGNPVIPIPVDRTKPFPPMPYDMAVDWFLQDVPEPGARRYHSLMPDESPTAVWEVASGGAVSIDRTRIGGPSLMIAGGKDIVVPADVVRRSAAHFGSDYLFLNDRGHSMILEPRWQEIAERIRSWLDRTTW
jgi:pimeloyl-ACP methyl ester carboxylesterase